MASAGCSPRLKDRPGHFFPDRLLDSQLEALEPIEPDERSIVIDVALDPDAQLAAALRTLGQSDFSAKSNS